MCNHVHLIVVPKRENSVSRTLQYVHGGYALYFNSKYSKSGHLWQGRFKSTVLDEIHLWNAVRYVERNPVRAGIVERARDYRWSSAAVHCDLRDDKMVSDDLPLVKEITNWDAWLKDDQSEEEVNFIRDRTQTGRPCADDEFLKSLERQVGKKLF
jgi:putative transposase